MLLHLHFQYFFLHSWALFSQEAIHRAPAARVHEMMNLRVRHGGWNRDTVAVSMVKGRADGSHVCSECHYGWRFKLSGPEQHVAAGGCRTDVGVFTVLKNFTYLGSATYAVGWRFLTTHDGST